MCQYDGITALWYIIGVALMGIDPRHTQIEDGKDGFTVSTIDPYRILGITNNREIAEFAVKCTEAALQTLTTKYPEEERPKLRLVVNRRRA